MKRILSILHAIMMFTGTLVYSQTSKLWGVTFYGGTNNKGTIYKMNLDGSGFNVVYNASQANGTYPCGGLIQATNYKLYGMTSAGGANDQGVIFSINPATNTYTVVHNFAADLAINSFNKLFLANDGKLYGMTLVGGANNDGIIFSFDPANNTFTRLFDFEYTVTGSFGEGSLMQASNGLIYGINASGGPNGGGVLFSFNIVNNTFNRLHSFSDTGTGPSPNGAALIQDGTGLLYGTSDRGGNYGKGTIFTYNITSGSLTKRCNFNGSSDPKGSYPYGALVKTTPGSFYGMTYSGGNNNAGVLFLYSTYGPVTVTLLSFSSVNKGSHPDGALIQAADNKFYGTTSEGGVYDKGVVFKFDVAGNTLTKIHEFSGNDGFDPNGDLLEVTCTGVPSTPGSITMSGGSASVCPGDVRTYSVPAVAGVTYTWSSFTGASVTTGQGTNTVGVTFTTAFSASGILKVKAVNNCGSSAYSTLTIQKNTAPVTPGAISGSASVCNGMAVIYSIAAVAGAGFYEWTIPADSNIRTTTGTSLTVVWGATGGNITVRAVNGCGTSGLSTKAVTVNCREGLAEQNITEISAVVFPNPTNGLTTLKFNSNENQVCELIIVDHTGRIIKQEQLSASEGINEHSLDMTGFVKGVYLVKIKTQSGESVKRVVRN